MCRKSVATCIASIVLFIFAIFYHPQERDGFRLIAEAHESEVTREVVTADKDKISQLQQHVNTYSRANEELEQIVDAKEQENTTLRQTVEQVSVTF